MDKQEVMLKDGCINIKEKWGGGAVNQEWGLQGAEMWLNITECLYCNPGSGRN